MAKRHRHRALQLRPLHRRERSGRKRPRGHRALREHAGAPQQRDRQRVGDARGPRAPGVMSISSYSRSPSWATVSPPACTNRRDGKVGRPTSVGPPSTVRPRSTTATRTRPVTTVPAATAAGASAAGGPGCRGCRGRPAPARGPRRPAQLDGGAHLDRLHPGAARPVDVGGQVVHAAQLEPGPEGTALHEAAAAGGRVVDQQVVVRGAPVVGVAHVAAVDQLAEPGEPVDRERASGRVDLEVDRPVAQPQRAGLHGLHLGAPSGPAAATRSPGTSSTRASTVTAGRLVTRTRTSWPGRCTRYAASSARTGGVTDRAELPHRRPGARRAAAPCRPGSRP